LTAEAKALKKLANFEGIPDLPLRKTSGNCGRARKEGFNFASSHPDAAGGILMDGIGSARPCNDLDRLARER
jgi:hypothetical protein